LPEDVLKHYGYDSRPAGDLGDDALYQARPSEETSNRYLLANALESAAQTDEERQKLQQYREQIQNAENLEERLDKLNRRIFEYSFAPGPRDAAKLNEMRETAKRMARQLDRMDKKLLGLEATKPMKDLLERERKLERHRIAISAYHELTTLFGDPTKKPSIFSATVFRIRCLLSVGAHAI
ncbi:MAG: hypothetical protein J6Q30_05485, partial [Oscillospiraceae bacterium]|nr:hypothetical protein [Oscillospiraceae bacterium]